MLTLTGSKSTTTLVISIALTGIAAFISSTSTVAIGRSVASATTARIARLQNTQDKTAIESFITRQARREHGEEYPDARKIVEGDLDKDSIPETVVLYTIEGQGGSNNYIQYLAVFSRQKGNLFAVTYTPVGGKSRRSIELTSITDNVINLETLNYGPKDPSCCPSVKGKIRYVLVGRVLREQKSTSARKP